MEEKSEARTSSEGEILTLAAVLALGIGAGVARCALGAGEGIHRPWRMASLCAAFLEDTEILHVGDHFRIVCALGGEVCCHADAVILELRESLGEPFKF